MSRKPWFLRQLLRVMARREAMHQEWLKEAPRRERARVKARERRARLKAEALVRLDAVYHAGIARRAAAKADNGLKKSTLRHPVRRVLVRRMRQGVIIDTAPLPPRVLPEKACPGEGRDGNRFSEKKQDKTED